MRKDSDKPIRVFKSEGIIFSIWTEVSYWGFESHREEKSHPLSAIELIPFRILYLSVLFSILETNSISYLKDSGRGETV